MHVNCADMSVWRGYLPNWSSLGKYPVLVTNRREAVLRDQAMCYQRKLWEDTLIVHAILPSHLVWRLEVCRMLSGGSVQLFRHYGSRICQSQHCPGVGFFRPFLHCLNQQSAIQQLDHGAAPKRNDHDHQRAAALLGLRQRNHSMTRNMKHETWPKYDYFIPSVQMEPATANLMNDLQSRYQESSINILYFYKLLILNNYLYCYSYYLIFILISLLLSGSPQ